MCQKLWKLAGSRQSYCKNYLAYFFWPTLYIALNAAYSCFSIIYCMHWSLKQSQINISIRKCKTKTSNEHKHCTMQPFDTAFGGGGHKGRGRHWKKAPPAPFSHRTATGWRWRRLYTYYRIRHVRRFQLRNRGLRYSRDSHGYIACCSCISGSRSDISTCSLRTFTFHTTDYVTAAMFMVNKVLCVTLTKFLTDADFLIRMLYKYSY